MQLRQGTYPYKYLQEMANFTYAGNYVGYQIRYFFLRTLLNICSHIAFSFIVINILAALLIIAAVLVIKFEYVRDVARRTILPSALIFLTKYLVRESFLWVALRTPTRMRFPTGFKIWDSVDLCLSRYFDDNVYLTNF